MKSFTQKRNDYHEPDMARTTQADIVAILESLIEAIQHDYGNASINLRIKLARELITEIREETNER